MPAHMAIMIVHAMLILISDLAMNSKCHCKRYMGIKLLVWGLRRMTLYDGLELFSLIPLMFQRTEYFLPLLFYTTIHNAF